MASTAIPALQTLYIGSIQDLMTLRLHTHLPPWHPFTTAQTLTLAVRFLQNHDSEGPRISTKAVVGVDEWPQLLSQLFKHLI